MNLLRNESAATQRTTRPSAGNAAFTLVEMLVVIGVIGILAGMVLFMAGGAGEQNQRKAAESLIHELDLAIKSYKDTMGFLPPDNEGDVKRPPLYYELKGTKFDGNQYAVVEDGHSIDLAVINANFGLPGFINSQDLAAGETTVPIDHFENLKPSYVDSPPTSPARYIVFPRAGPEGQFNTVRYDKTSGDRHNLGKDGFDIWIDLSIGNKTVTVGNWK